MYFLSEIKTKTYLDMLERIAVSVLNHMRTGGCWEFGHKRWPQKQQPKTKGKT